MACLRPAELACIDHTSARGTRETGRLVQVQKVKNDTWEAGNFPSSPPDSSPPDHNDETQKNERCPYHDKDLTYIHAQAPSDCIHPQSETGGGSGIVAMDKKTSHLLGPPREAQFQVNLFQALGGNRYSPTMLVNGKKME
ncbi:hypothetical protein I7I51_02473 [Histoplasma capsulatum]|uniref:Uncharacterized protein n=1 Tax=Ajellomyces capsulatus TaxID=5037 RepID=A0A8A1MDQ1_AJECA|nr:hypothetical protein I7I51_02473 [Histoplasma capsulatum]